MTSLIPRKNRDTNVSAPPTVNPDLPAGVFGLCPPCADREFPL